MLESRKCISLNMLTFNHLNIVTNTGERWKWKTKTKYVVMLQFNDIFCDLLNFVCILETKKKVISIIVAYDSHDIVVKKVKTNKSFYQYDKFCFASNYLNR